MTTCDYVLDFAEDLEYAQLEVPISRTIAIYFMPLRIKINIHCNAII